MKSISAWREINWNIGTDLDGLPESMQEVTDTQAQHQISQEFQLTGKAFGDRLDYVAGLYYFNEGGFVHDYVPFDTGYLYIYDYSNDVHTSSYAGYFHVDYKVTDAWTVGGTGVAASACASGPTWGRRRRPCRRPASRAPRPT